MIKKDNRIFTNLYGFDSPFFKEACKRGDWKDIKKFLNKTANDIIEQVTKSGLRGRGGAGFSTGMKWSFMPKKIINNII